jgi:hypothetical protein
MLQPIGFPDTDTVIRNSRNSNEENLARIDYSDLIAPAEELGLLDVHRGINSFARERLVKWGKENNGATRSGHPTCGL